MSAFTGEADIARSTLWRPLMTQSGLSGSAQAREALTTFASDGDNLARKACNSLSQAPYLYYWHAGT